MDGDIEEIEQQFLNQIELLVQSRSPLGRKTADELFKMLKALEHECENESALLHDSTAARVGALFQLLVQDTTAQDFGLPSSAIRLRM